MWKCSVCKTEVTGIACRTCGTLRWEDLLALRSLAPLSPADIRALRDRKKAWEQERQKQAQAREQEKKAWMGEMERRFQTMLDAQLSGKLASSAMGKRTRELEAQVETLKQQKGAQDLSGRLKSLESEIVEMKLQFTGKSPSLRVLEIKQKSMAEELEKQRLDNAALRTRVGALEARLREQKSGSDPAARSKAAAAQETAVEIWLRGQKLYGTDVRGAVKLFRQAAELGHPAAQNDMGFAYEIGRGVEMDPIQAATWYRKAAVGGDPHGQINLGSCYQYGKGVAPDIDKAIHWYRQAAEQGLTSAQYRLGLLYKNSNGTKKDIPAAALWLKKAAEGGHASAREAYNGLFTLADSAMLNAKGYHRMT